MLERVEAVVKLEAFRDAAELSTNFRNDWSCFHAAAPQATPFQSPDWLLTWWQHFGSGQLRVFAFRSEENALIAVIPCFLHEWSGRRQLTLIGSGISDYLEPVIAPAYRTSVMQILAEYLQSSESWNVCNWQDLSINSALADLANYRHLHVHTEADPPCSQVPLSRNFDRYWTSRPSGLRRNVKRYRQKAEEIASLTFEQASSCSAEYLDALIRLHSVRWREQGEPGMIGANRSGPFVRDICRLFAEKQLLLLFALRFQGEIAAVILSFPRGKEIFAYLSAFDPAHGALGVGRLLLYESIRYASNNGYSSWNFLRGDEPYKTDWGAKPINKLRLIVTRDCDTNVTSIDKERSSSTPSALR